MYSFIGVREDLVPAFDDQSFAMALLEQRHVLIAPGSSFNVPYRNHFRITHLPLPDTLDEVFRRIEDQLDAHVLAHTSSTHAALPPAAARTTGLKIVS